MSRSYRKGDPRRATSRRGNAQLRQQIAREAARLMYEEGVGQYLDAKHLAARRVLGPREARGAQFRPRDLPGNGEIRAALLALAELAEGPDRQRRLFAMRVTALEAMEALAPFSPRLIGSVSSGHIRRGSDIDLHVFVDEQEDLEDHLAELGWPYASQEVAIWKNGQVCEYLHVYVELDFPVELSVYPRFEIRVRTRSSTDGKPIDRVPPHRLREQIARDHPEDWARYLALGRVPDIDDILASATRARGAFDGLLADPPERVTGRPTQEAPCDTNESF